VILLALAVGVSPAGAQQPGPIAITSPKTNSYTASTTVTLSWTAPATTSQQALYLTYTPGPSGPPKPTTQRLDGAARSWTPTGLKPGYYTATLGVSYPTPAECAGPTAEDPTPIWCFPSGDYASCQTEMLGLLPRSSGISGDCAEPVQFVVVNPITAAKARIYMDKVVASWNETPPGLRGRTHCSTLNVLVARCTLTGTRNGWRVRASGLVFHQFNPSMRNVGFRVSLSMRYRNVPGPVHTKLSAPSEGWVCRLIAIPFREKEDPPDPSC
jgi:hypothetical protein